MGFNKREWVRYLAGFAKTLVLWLMLISGIVLATRQARAAFAPSSNLGSSNPVS